MHLLSVIVLIASFVAFAYASYPAVVKNGNNYYNKGKQNMGLSGKHSALLGIAMKGVSQHRKYLGKGVYLEVGGMRVPVVTGKWVKGGTMMPGAAPFKPVRG